MSAAQTQEEAGEAAWGCMEALGLSPKELVLAEALQMEYDALSRIKRDHGGGGAGAGAGHAPSNSNTPSYFLQRLRPGSSPTGDPQLMGLSGSDPNLNQPGGSQSPPAVPPRLAPPQAKDLLHILDTQESKFSSGFLSKGSALFPDDTPPAIPPRNPLPHLGAGSDNPFLPPRGSPAVSTFRDINLFLPDLDPPKVGGAELNFDTINQSLAQLNAGRRGRGDQSGKPVARSKTLPPQVPPRTYVPMPKSSKNQRRVSADPVRTGVGVGGGLL